MTETSDKPSRKPPGRRRKPPEDTATMRRFLVELGKGTTLSGAARRVKLPYRTLMSWLAVDGPQFRPEFARNVAVACQQSRESVVADLAEMGRRSVRRVYRIVKGKKKLFQEEVRTDPSALAKVADLMHGVGSRLEVEHSGVIETKPLSAMDAGERLELARTTAWMLGAGGAVETTDYTEQPGPSTPPTAPQRSVAAILLAPRNPDRVSSLHRPAHLTPDDIEYFRPDLWGLPPEEVSERLARGREMRPDASRVLPGQFKVVSGPPKRRR